ncbi:MAG: glycosyltransferase [Chloroflexi bacterium]|nr:glycosyltransferase [Chloroflexota bacterium]
MKVLQVTNMLSGKYGGAAEVPFQLSRELAARGHQVTIYTSDLGLGREKVESLPGVTVRAFKTGLALAGFCLTPGMMAAAKKEVRDFDIVHLHNYRTFPNVVVSHYARKYGVPYLLQAHGSVATYFQKGQLKRAFDRLAGWRMLRNAVQIIASTQAEAGQYRAAGISGTKIGIVPNGIDLAQFADLPPRGEFRRKHGVADETRIVLYLGRIHRIKGLDLLAKAFAGLSPLVRATLVIAGPDAGYLAALRRLVRELKAEARVLFVGPLYGMAKLEAFVDAEVYVLPSVYETFPVAVLEACACGIPVVITDRCGIAGVIDGRAGLAVPYDADRLRGAISSILENDKLAREFGERGKALVRKEFNWAKVAERFEAVYGEIFVDWLEPRMVQDYLQRRSR